MRSLPIVLEELCGEDIAKRWKVLVSNGEVLEFYSWNEVKIYYREGARLLDQAVFEARFFFFAGHGWTEVDRPTLVN